MPRNPNALTKIMENALRYIEENLTDEKFSSFDIPRTIINRGYVKVLDGLARRGYLDKISDNHYKYKPKTTSLPE